MTRSDDGAWSTSLKDVPSGIWEYSFNVDGVNVMDSTNPAIKPQREPAKNILHVASNPPAAWDWQDIPHGALHVHQYQSKATGGMRESWVYTPADYGKESTKRYPLMILQHGSSDNQQAWTVHGKAHWIMDSLIHSGKAVPMVVLMLDGHPTGKVDRTDIPGRVKALQTLQREIFDDALPLVEREYRVSSEPKDRAICGLSMGGLQAFTIGLNHADRFAWIGSFSGAAVPEVVEKPLSAAADTNAKVKLLWIACGKDDFLLQRNLDMVALLKGKGVVHEWHLTEGDHSWPVWRGYLTEFAPRLFR
jgi:enterochelin esterase family protein